MRSRPLLDWLDRPSPERGIRFAAAGDAWDFWSYERLAALALRIGAGLSRAGVRRDDIVCIAQRSGPEFVGAFFGTLAAGATPSPIVPPLVFQDETAYGQHLAAVVRTAQPSAMIADTTVADRLAAFAVPDIVTTVDELLAHDDGEMTADAREPAELALLQFTSGSSGPSRAVRVPFAALEANILAIRRWLHWSKDDAFASWLPVYHDMGLVGAVLSSVVGGSDLWLLQPEQFVRRPLRYLRCFGVSGAVLTVMPNFGLQYIVRRTTPADLDGCDFSGWRGIVIGAERIDATTLDAYSELLGPFGFSRRALLPAYGLAEASLAATGVRMGTDWTSVAVESSALSVGHSIATRSASPSSQQVVVGCGQPLDGVDVSIIDDDGAPLPAGTIGEIAVRGTSLAAGYLRGSDSPSLTSFSGDVLKTGDAGFQKDGELFVLGRLGDSLKIRGRVVFGEELEVAASHLGVPRERVAALLGVHHGRPTVVLVFERFEGAWTRIEELVRPLASDARIVFVSAPAGTIARTSSGKPKRRQLWRAFADGVLPGRATIGIAEVDA